MTQRHVVCIFNPAAAGGKNRQRLGAARRCLSRSFVSFELLLTEGPGHATVLTRDALERGCDQVIAFGGDGTTNEVLAGFMDDDGDNGFPGAELGIVAVGTGSDFQRHLGPASMEQQVLAVARGPAHRIDYGVAHMVSSDGQPLMRPFLNEASVGMSGLVGRHVQRAPRLLGPASTYVWSSIRSLVEHRDKAVTLVLEDDRAREIPLTLAVMANGQYFGGGMWIAPEAQCDDGWLDVLYTGGAGKLDFLGLLARVFKGAHVGAASVHTARSRTVRMVPKDDRDVVLISIDGEQPGRLPASFHIVPGGIRVRAHGLPTTAPRSSGRFEPVGDPDVPPRPTPRSDKLIH